MVVHSYLVIGVIEQWLVHMPVTHATRVRFSFTPPSKDSITAKLFRVK